jgi:hypothetical protein
MHPNNWVALIKSDQKMKVELGCRKLTIEAMLKIIVRDRKNAMFHKTLLGATIGDIITSVIATGSEAGINVFDYFTTLQREKEQVKAHPENYLPWNYLAKSSIT